MRGERGDGRGKRWRCGGDGGCERGRDKRRES